MRNGQIIVNANGNLDNSIVGIDIQADRVEMGNQSRLFSQSSDGRAGDILVQAEHIQLDHGSLIFTTTIQGRAGDIRLLNAQILTLHNAAQVINSTSGTGYSGDVIVKAQALILADGAGIGSITSASGNTGNIWVDAGTATIRNGALIINRTFGAGDSGDVTVMVAGTLLIDGFNEETSSQISASSAPGSEGDAGNVRVEAQTVTLTRGGQIQSGTGGAGDGGQVLVVAQGAVELDGFGRGFSSQIVASSARDATGDAGSVQVEGQTVSLTNGAQIQSSTSGTGQGGNVTVKAHGTVTMGGFGEDSVSLISANSGEEATGNAGSVRVEAQTVSLTNGAQIISATFGEGQGGDVMVYARDTVSFVGTSPEGEELLGELVPGDTTFPSGAFVNSHGPGKPGDVQVTAPTVILADGGRISSLTLNSTEGGGTVRVNAPTMLRISGSGSGIRTQSTGLSVGGDITLQTGTLELADAALITAESTGAGNAGNITIEVRDTFLSENSSVTTKATRADGGDIQVTVQSVLRLRDSQITASVGGGPETTGGNIAINSELVVLENSQVTANAFEGTGGNIRIVADGFLPDATSTVSASSALGIDGQVEIQALTNLNRNPLPLTQRFVETPTLQYQRCAEQLREGKASRFVLAGRDDIPFEPGGVLSSAPYRTEIPGAGRDAYQALRQYSLALQERRYRKAQGLLDEAWQQAQDVAPSAATAYLLIDIGLAYNDLRLHLPDANAQLGRLASEILKEAGDIAETSSAPRAASYAWGYLGALYKAERQYRDALQLTRRARFAAQKAHAPESLYRWEWQTGSLLRALRDINAAIAAYEYAVETAQSIRPALLRRNSGDPTSFRRTTGPLYFELVDLYLRRAAALEESDQEAVYPQYEFYLERARAVVEQFKEAELRDYFKDSCVDATLSPIRPLHTVSQQAVIVYPILLPDRTELLVSLPIGQEQSELKRFVVSVGADSVRQEIRALRQQLDNDELREQVKNAIFPDLPDTYRSHAQKLYDLLVRPFEPALTHLPIDTLVFVPDGLLRTIPMAVLHDGKEFLIEKYALAVTPGLRLIAPLPMTPGKIRALAAGVSTPVQGRFGLPLVPEELQSVQSIYGGKVLMNEEFCFTRLETALRHGQFGIVHIASHGEFVQDAEQSFILTFDDELSIDNIEQLVKPLRFRDQPLELLTLSACSTAVGDDRAALGLAGMAIRAGAKSTVATLWSIQDESTPFLLTEFYQQLQDPSISRAGALRRAQLKLMRDTSYDHPFFWSPFILINNWL
jgi:CHAT domain-containing protein